VGRAGGRRAAKGYLAILTWGFESLTRARVTGLLLVVLCVAGSNPDSTTVEFVYIGSASCGFCRRPEMDVELRQAMTRIRAAAAGKGWAFESVCISVDTDPDAAEEFVAGHCAGFDRNIHDGLGFQTPEYVKYIKKLSTDAGVDLQVDGVPWVVVAVTTGSETRVRSRYLGTILMSWLKEDPPISLD